MSPEFVATLPKFEPGMIVIAKHGGLAHVGPMDAFIGKPLTLVREDTCKGFWLVEENPYVWDVRVLSIADTEIRCRLPGCQAKNDAGVKTCWRCGNAP